MDIDHMVEGSRGTWEWDVEAIGDETYQIIPQHPHSPLQISSPLSRIVTKVQVRIV